MTIPHCSACRADLIFASTIAAHNLACAATGERSYRWTAR